MSKCGVLVSVTVNLCLLCELLKELKKILLFELLKKLKEGLLNHIDVCLLWSSLCANDVYGTLIRKICLCS